MRTTDSQLRLRFLASLAASGALVGASLAACGGVVERTGNGNGSSGSSGTSGSSNTSSSSGYSSSGYSSSGTTTSPPPPPAPPPATGTCMNGSKGTTTCYTHAQLESQLRSSPGRGGDSLDAGDPDADVSAYFDPNGCLPAKLVEDTCCNPAVAGPFLSGVTCCYVHCSGSCCGRPFLVAGQPRVAERCERSDWTSPLTSASTASALDAGVRERIAAAWARDAAMEHASIASFARFTLELLALGAPADIVLAAQDATRDEVEHATACFSIASRYEGRSLGPGKLDVRGAVPSIELEAVLSAAIVEGCIGETLSALLAEARLARAEDADVRAALGRIATEEARHAELAWRFVGWAVASGGDAVRDVAAQTFERALARAPQSWDSGVAGIAPATLRAHGLLDEAAAREVAERALRDVVAPCAAVLVGDRAADQRSPFGLRVVSASAASSREMERS